MPLGKFLIALLIFSNLIASILNVTCNSSSKCMACNGTTENKCDACYNWASGTILARVLDTNGSPPSCVTKLTLLTDNCLMYNGQISKTATARDANSCLLCKTDFLYYSAEDNTLKC